MNIVFEIPNITAFHPDDLLFLSFATLIENLSILLDDLPRRRHRRTGAIRIMPIIIHQIGVAMGGRRKMKITKIMSQKIEIISQVWLRQRYTRRQSGCSVDTCTICMSYTWMS
ncbi:hypothetical protein ACTXT7_004952 [Hymenolepis weldensis]